MNDDGTDVPAFLIGFLCGALLVLIIVLAVYW